MLHLKPKRNIKPNTKTKGESMTFTMKARRAGWLLVVAAFAFGIVSAIRPAPTQAYNLISTRSIKMSSAQQAATNTIYSVGFTTNTAAQTIGSVVIRFCSNNPIIGDTCNAPLNFDVNRAGLSINNQTCTLAGFSVSTTQGGTNTLVLTRTPSSIPTGTAACFDLGNGSTNGITNPNTTNTTFFARILVFGTSTPTLTAPADENAATDAGGVALSTTNVLNVTAKVQEALTFCLYTQANCAAGGNAVNLGDSNNVLAATNVTYTDATPKFDLSSNALGGVTVRMKGDTLTSGSFTITAFGATCAADSTSSSVEQFGVRVVTYGTGQYFGDAAVGSTAPTGSVNDFSCNAGFHKFDPTTANTTYGQNFVKTIGATDVSTTNFELAAKAAGTTEAGVYTSKLQFIATATY
jgi:hypothetical protein